MYTAGANLFLMLFKIRSCVIKLCEFPVTSLSKLQTSKDPKEKHWKGVSKKIPLSWETIQYVGDNRNAKTLNVHHK